MTKILQELLGEFKNIKGIKAATLVSRSGMYISGDVPPGAHNETYVAMAAIILGASEASSTELKKELSHIEVDMTNAWVYLFGCGTKALLVLFADTKVNIAGEKGPIDDLMDKIRENMA